jgi:predicted DNA binding protein
VEKPGGNGAPSERGMFAMKEVTIEAEDKVDRWAASVLSKSNAVIKTVDCRPFGRKGMIELIEITCHASVKDVLRLISSEPNIVYTSFTVFDKHRASGIIVTKVSPVCRAMSSMMGFCTECAMVANLGPQSTTKWQVVFPGKISLKSFLAELKREGINASVTEVGKPTGNRSLTYEQERAIGLAEEEGYFRFPRSTSLKELSATLGISPSTLDEVLRRAEGKIVADHVGKPRRTPRH